MARTVGKGHQDFEVIRRENYFYIDKTAFIKEWWKRGEQVTLIARPRRFGKTLNMSMLEKFFSVQYKDRGDLFQGLEIWEDEEFRKLQGTYPVLFISFASVKENSYIQAKKKICWIIREAYSNHYFFLKRNVLSEQERQDLENISAKMEECEAADSIKVLLSCLFRYYGKKVIVLLDEYDTPIQEAYASGYLEEMVPFIRSIFDAVFHNNPYLERAIMIGITNISTPQTFLEEKPMFFDWKNLDIVTIISEKYMDCFGFTEEEVFAALEDFGLSDRKQEVKRWYDGFVFGGQKSIYNPWAISNYLDKKQPSTYWADTSSNSLVGQMIQKGSKDLKIAFESLLRGEAIIKEIDERIVYDRLDTDERLIWSLLLVSGYLRAKKWKTCTSDFEERNGKYELEFTNFEVKIMFWKIVRNWFGSASDNYDDFIKALFLGDIEAMNTYMNRITLTTFRCFQQSEPQKRLQKASQTDTGKNPSRGEPERFYHGFILSLMVELVDRYILTSNKESGFGRYDVMLEPRRPEDDGIILEFKVQDTEEERKLVDTVKEALAQIDRQKYETALMEKGVPREKIRKYGFAFRGKRVLIGGIGE